MISRNLQPKKLIAETIFRRIHGNNLVYNTCWEDPRCDRALLNINQESKIVMITSAGCNALDYLQDNPAEIHCVDMNPRQNALLDLKLALLQHGDHEILFDLMGKGRSKYYREIHEEVIDPLLKDQYSRQYWRNNRNYFSGKGARASFYWHGTSGTVAWCLQKWLSSQPRLRKRVTALFEAGTLEEQQTIYRALEPRIFNQFFRWLVRQHFFQSMLGVPKSQQALAAERFPDGMIGYVRQCFRHVFMELPLHDNYFWQLYFFGRYTADCCPSYLNRDNMTTLRASSQCVSSYTSTVSQFLEENPGQYTHFILLDHQDWLAEHLKDELTREWNLIIQNAAPNARVLMRSAAFDVDFLPSQALENVRFDYDLAREISTRDRVGTYASTLIGTIHQ